MRSIFLSLLLFSALAAGQTAPAISTYTSDDLHFTFTYPAFVVSSNDAKPPVPPAQRATQGTAAILDCASFPLAAKRDGNDSDFDLLMMNRLDFTCGKSPLPTRAELRQAATQTVNASMTGMKQSVGRPVAYKLNGADAFFVRASATDESHTVYSTTACTVLRSNLLCWTGFSSSLSHADAMLAGTITFAGQPPQALVPKAVFAQANR